MKRIFGLDLGTASVGWAVVDQATDDKEQSSILGLGSRVVPLVKGERPGQSEQSNYENGKPIMTNALRRQRHSARLNLHRYKLRRQRLIKIFREQGWITNETLLAETGADSTFATRRLRAKAATERIGLDDLARVFLMINKKRGYSSIGNDNDIDDVGTAVNSIAIARELSVRGITPGQWGYEHLSGGKRHLPDFYRSDLMAELRRVCDRQREFYPQLSVDVVAALSSKSEKQGWAAVASLLDLKGARRQAKGFARKVEDFHWRAEALCRRLEPEELAVVISKICGQIAASSSYLGAISDRSKLLVESGMTIGQFQMAQLEANPNRALKKEVYYRNDYKDEFDRIWSTQARFYPQLTEDLRKEIFDRVIFYQRPLKSQKKNVAFCKFESREVEVMKDGKLKKYTSGLKVVPVSSPLYQSFRMWQRINDLRVSGTEDRRLTDEERRLLADELQWRGKMTKTEVLRLLFQGKKGLELNFKEIVGDVTRASILDEALSVVETSGHEIDSLAGSSGREKAGLVRRVFEKLGYDTGFLDFDPLVDGDGLDRQNYYRLWHILYSLPKPKMEDGPMIPAIMELTGMDRESALIMAKARLEKDYGSLSAKAIRRILPFMMKGEQYSDACRSAGYNHSESATRQQIADKELARSLEILPKNSLRNPVVEKILNQMINVVNSLIETYGNPDEIHVELARELKRSAKGRRELSDAISAGEKNNARIREILQKQFNRPNPSRNDVIRYRLYEELELRGYKTLYSETYISKEELFSKRFDVEHIIPKSRLFDDSYANKTLEERSVNEKKSKMTAIDFVENEYGEEGLARYRNSVRCLFEKGVLSKAKRDNLLRRKEDIPDDFINRDIKDTQYISRRACEILKTVTRDVVATSGTITSRLREDWNLTGIMQEINLDKYNRQGLVESYVDGGGQTRLSIKGWSKRNDHRHHALDALVIAFTRREYITYLNTLNSYADDPAKRADLKWIYVKDRKKILFREPMSAGRFRSEIRNALERTLVSFKAKNKVLSSGKGPSGSRGMTPRGRLHEDTLYGRIRCYVTKEETVNASFAREKILKVACQEERVALLRRLDEFGGDPKKAFAGKNSLSKNPLWLDAGHTRQLHKKVKTVELDLMYTTRKEVSADLKVDKVIDEGVRKVLIRRIEESGGDSKRAFSNLSDNPIWLNREKGIAIKRVTIKGPNEVIPIHFKHDHLGNQITDGDGRPVPNDFVATGNNHHVALFRSPDGRVVEQIVTFMEAVARGVAEPAMPVIDRSYGKDDGLEFMFTLKKNEYVVFPRYETRIDADGNETQVKVFDPKTVDLLDRNSYSAVSPNLFRVQKITKHNYTFHHHLETTDDKVSALRDITWKRITDIQKMDDVVKVRVDRLGRIVAVGEY